MLFSGIPAGLIFFSHIAKKWLTSAAPKIIIGFLTWPIYTLAGAVGAIPLVVYLIYRLWKGRHIAKKWLTSAAPKIIIGFLTWPIYTLAGAVGAIPLVVYLIYRLWKGRILCQKCKLHG